MSENGTKIVEMIWMRNYSIGSSEKGTLLYLGILSRLRGCTVVYYIAAQSGNEMRECMKQLCRLAEVGQKSATGYNLPLPLARIRQLMTISFIHKGSSTEENTDFFRSGVSL